MPPINWQHVQELYVQALEQPQDARIAFLDRACQGASAPLRDQVEELLRLSADGENALWAQFEQLFATTAEAIQAEDPAVNGTEVFNVPHDVGLDIKLIRYVGGGGIGEVYEALDRNLGRVALKMIQRRHLDDPSIMRLFDTQVPLMARLRHPKIVQVHHVGQHEGRPYFTMNFIDGTSLEHRLDEFRQDSRRAAQLVLKVTGAILHAHQREIIHRDLKPANILLDENGEPVVTDLDLAKHLGDALEFRGGTLPYMSPEQATVGQEVTTVSDVYGLGALLYALLTGRPPFWHRNRAELLRLVRDPSQRPAPPRSLNGKVDPDLEAICLKCLEKDPARRYQSAAGLARDLELWLQGHRPDGAVRRNPPYDLWRWIKRNPVWTVALAAGVLAIGLLDWTISQAWLKERERQLLQSNASTAHSVANTFGGRLEFWSSAVLREAQDKGLRGDLKDKRSAGLNKRMRAINRFYADPAHGFVRAKGESPFASWFVLDCKGVVLAHGAEDKVIGQPCGDRDYFLGARKLRDGSLHISRVYQGRAGGDFYKFALAAPIWDEGNNLLGVLVASVTTDSAEETLLPRHAPQKAVLIGRWDGTPPQEPNPGLRHDVHRPGQRLLLLHPAFAKRHRAVEIHNERLLSEQEQGGPGHGLDDRYEDPLATEQPGFAGRWLAAAVPVPGTEFAVIVQQEYEAVQPEAIIGRPRVLWLMVAPALALVVAAGILVSAWRRNQPKSTRGKGSVAQIGW